MTSTAGRNPNIQLDCTYDSILYLCHGNCKHNCCWGVEVSMIEHFSSSCIKTWITRNANIGSTWAQTTLDVTDARKLPDSLNIPTHILLENENKFSRSIDLYIKGISQTSFILCWIYLSIVTIQGILPMGIQLTVTHVLASGPFNHRSGLKEAYP